MLPTKNTQNVDFGRFEKPLPPTYEHWANTYDAYIIMGTDTWIKRWYWDLFSNVCVYGASKLPKPGKDDFKHYLDHCI